VQTRANFFQFFSVKTLRETGRPSAQTLGGGRW
jgi:hypothetical protein